MAELFFVPRQDWTATGTLGDGQIFASDTPGGGETGRSVQVELTQAGYQAYREAFREGSRVTRDRRVSWSGGTPNNGVARQYLPFSVSA